MTENNNTDNWNKEMGRRLVELRKHYGKNRGQARDRRKFTTIAFEEIHQTFEITYLPLSFYLTLSFFILESMLIK